MLMMIQMSIVFPSQTHEQNLRDLTYIKQTLLPKIPSNIGKLLVIVRKWVHAWQTFDTPESTLNPQASLRV